jgi:aminopeptidase N
VANPNLVVAQREVTTVPAQALYLMNNAFVTDQAKALARRLQDASGDDAVRIDLGYQLALSRPATPKERERVVKFLGEKPQAAAWAGFCQALLASAEFRYLD